MASNYTNFLNGVVIRDLPITQLHPGKIFWVNNSGILAQGGISGSDGNNGSYMRPFATIGKALTACTASRGDIIAVMPGHAETVSSATALTISVAGVAIIGLGKGTSRPAITLNTATTATVNVTAANVTLHNIVFIANFLAIAAAITTTTAKSLLINQCEFRDNSSILNFVTIVDTDTTTNDTDGLSLLNSNFFLLGTSSSTTVVKMDGTNERLHIEGCYLQNKSVTDGGALMIIATGKVATHARILSNVLNTTGVSSGTAGTIITTDGSTNTGVIASNFVQNLDATTEILVTASSGFVFFNNFSSAVADKSGYLLPAADA